MERQDHLPLEASSSDAENSKFKALPIDPWVAASLLQKSIRRGDTDLAEQAALTLHRLRGPGIWRRLVVIACEDVGVASLDALVNTVMACCDPVIRHYAGCDMRVVSHLARLLAASAKDRSADHLICLVHGHPMLETVRGRVAGLSLQERLTLATGNAAPFFVRAVATWFASGIRWNDEPQIGESDLAGLLTAFRKAGVPERLTNTVMMAAPRTREPMVAMLPLLWLAVQNDPLAETVVCEVPPAPVVCGVPAYALDKHTRVGKAAIHRFARENAEVRKVLEDQVPDSRRKDAACMTAFYADGAPVALRHVWNQCFKIEELGIENDLLLAGVPRGGIRALRRAVRDNLEHLNAIRCDLLLAAMKRARS